MLIDVWAQIKYQIEMHGRRKNISRLSTAQYIRQF